MAIDRTNPYSKCEQRVCDYLNEITNNEVGCGDDPIGFLIACHAQLREEVKLLKCLINPENYPYP